MNCIIEICAASYQSAIAATRAGADRIELCSELGAGGITPSCGMIEEVRHNSDIAMNILIRPRSGDFLYTSEEAEIILRDIAFCARMGVQGIVVGALDPEGNIDRTMAGDWLKAAHRNGLSATFHRAVDNSADILGAVDDIASLGYDRILTSGGKATAFEGMDTIKKMVKMTSGSGLGKKTIIMPGSGVNPSNIKEIVEYTGVSEIHFSASRKYKSGMKVLGGIAKEEFVTHSDEGTILEAMRSLNRI